MMNIPRFRILIFLPLIMALGSFLFLGYSNKKNLNIHSLDPIAETPNWVKVLGEEMLPSDGLCSWVPTGNFETSSLIKLPRFPRKYSEEELKNNKTLKTFVIAPSKTSMKLRANAVKNERFSGQIAFASKQDVSKLKIQTSALSSSKGERIPTENIKIRYVGYVPIERSKSEFVWSAKYEDVIGVSGLGMLNPNIIADPLYELNEVDIPAYRVQPVWISIDIPENISSGMYSSIWEVTNEAQEKIKIEVKIEVLDFSIPSSADYQFFLDLWLNPGAIATNYELTPWSEEHWEMLKKYLEDLASAGNKTITTIITQEPWRVSWGKDSMRSQTYTGFESMVKWRKLKTGEWRFDYSIFDKYVETAQSCGLTEKINAYSLTAFRGKERIHYFDEETNKIKEEYFESAKAKGYRKAWGAFLQDFTQHLKEKNWLNFTYLSFDEKPNETMNLIRQLIEEFAPEFSDRIAIAGHPESSTFATGSLSIAYEFFPNQNLSSEETFSVIEARNKAGKLTSFYLCGQPAHPNTLTFSPAVEARMIPWLAFKYQVNGYLRWSHNSWPKNPIQNPVFNFIQGDEYMIYPGEDGPMSSIRWELLKDGIEDYELVHLLQKQQLISDSVFSEAIELATKNEDGREKNIQDLVNARKILFR